MPIQAICAAKQVGRSGLDSTLLLLRDRDRCTEGGRASLEGSSNLRVEGNQHSAGRTNQQLLLSHDSKKDTHLGIEKSTLSDKEEDEAEGVM